MTISDSSTRLLNNIRSRCPGVVDEAIKYELFNVLNQFFQTTKAWKEDIDFVTVVDDDTYDIAPTDPGTIDSLIEVVNSDGIQQSATMKDLGTVLLGIKPSQVETLTATVSLTVVDPVDADSLPQFPDWVLPKWHDVIMHGLLGELHAQKAKPYSDERLAIFYQRKFRNGMATARNTINRQNTYGVQNWRFPSFG